MTVLVIGRSGQLATHLKPLLPGAIFWGRDEIDWQHQDNFVDKIVSASPSAIINTTAYTAVDKAETDRQTAWSVNVEGPRPTCHRGGDSGCAVSPCFHRLCFRR